MITKAFKSFLHTHQMCALNKLINNDGDAIQSVTERALLLLKIYCLCILINISYSFAPDEKVTIESA